MFSLCSCPGCRLSGKGRISFGDKYAVGLKPLSPGEAHPCVDNSAVMEVEVMGESLAVPCSSSGFGQHDTMDGSNSDHQHGMVSVVVALLKQMFKELSKCVFTDPATPCGCSNESRRCSCDEMV